MRGVMLEVPADLLRDRARAGMDRFDEMWEGELHMVPPPSYEHQRIEAELVHHLRGPATEAGLTLLFEVGLFDPAVDDATSYRQPDLVAFTENARSERGVEGAAALVIEIRSPGDESLDKLAYYERVGVGEVLVVDRDSKAVRRWLRKSGALVEERPQADGAIDLAALPASLRTADGRLVVTTAAGTSVV